MVSEKYLNYGEYVAKLTLQEKERFKNMVSEKYLNYGKYVATINIASC